MKKVLCLTIGGAALLGGCVPMEQSSLVYSSSNMVGVDVEAATPQNPGLLVAIGYRSLNAAYVPVLAAKVCPEEDAAKCDANAFLPIAIEGSHRTDGSSITSDGEIGQLVELIKREAGALGGAKTQLKQLEDYQLDLLRLRGEQGVLDQLGADASPEQAEKLNAITNEIVNLPIPNGSQDFVKAISSKRTEVEGLEDRFAQNSARLAAAREIASADVKTDALSVYGTFDGSGQGDAKGGGLSGGQVFSTGIAAQNLTKALEEANAIQQAVVCVQSLKVTFKDIDASELASLASQICKRTEKAES